MINWKTIDIKKLAAIVAASLQNIVHNSHNDKLKMADVHNKAIRCYNMSCLFNRPNEICRFFVVNFSFKIFHVMQKS